MDKNLDSFCSILSRETGLFFPPSRYPYILNKLNPLLEKYNISNPSELIIKSKQDIKLRIDIVNELTTNETWFFRHPEHFEILKKNIFPNLLKNKKDKTINIWSAGCSIGAELYSVLIAFKESVKDDSKYIINLLGSDISYNSIQKARLGIYNSYELKETNPLILEKYFDKQNNGCYKIKDDLKKNTTFEYLNLLETWPPRNYDIIFCRNTMIFFNEETKCKLIKRFFKALELDGYFFTSANEQIDFTNENYGVKKIFLNNEYVYQKSKPIATSCELYFKNPTEVLRATNLLRKFSYSFTFGSTIKNSSWNNLRCIIVSSSDCDKIINFLASNSIRPLKRI